MNDLLQLNVDAITMNDLIHNMKSSSSPTSSSRRSSPPTLNGSEVDYHDEDHEGSLMMGDNEALFFEVSPPEDLDLSSTLRPDDDDFGKIVVVVPQQKNTTVTDFIAEKEVEATLAQKESALERLPGASDDTATPSTEKFVDILAVESTTTGREEKEVLSNATTASITSREDVVRIQSNETKINASAYPDNAEDTDNNDTEQEKHSAEKFFDMSSRGRAHWHAVVDRKDSVSNLNDGTKPSYAEPETKDVSDRVPESKYTDGFSHKAIGKDFPSPTLLDEEESKARLQTHVQSDGKEDCEQSMPIDAKPPIMISPKVSSAAWETTRRVCNTNHEYENFSAKYIQLSMPRPPSWSRFFGMHKRHRLISLTRLFSNEDDDGNTFSEHPFAKLYSLAMEAYSTDDGVPAKQISFHFVHKDQEFVLLSTDDLIDALRVVTSNDDTMVIHVRQTVPVAALSVFSSLFSSIPPRLGLLAKDGESTPARSLFSSSSFLSSSSSCAYMAVVSMYLVAPMLYMGQMVTSFHRDKLLYTTESWK